ncbi:MAG: tRNA (adenosine(37)-N6)-threonylcarbamoyltransferase complex transferase subunit TsaD, partial [Candidatus Andersenbacteria bacterium]|nr:tRNA (adenosine(37)-N6)-threonylcarbamoyltransferase complex transferase subunit TsaD [Candidatus Andersenbacteria bacterium]
FIPDSASIFPALALIVSGGHTQLVNIPAHVTYQVIGATRDDAAGEAFDKVARLLGLPYPGGPPISALAAQGNPGAFNFTRPMLRSDDLDFSFSGLKTEVLYKLRGLGGISPTTRADLAASFEQAVVDVLITKTQAAVKKFHPRLILAAGGVLANRQLRRALISLAQETNIKLRLAPLSLCGDNAVMIGQAALFAYEAGRCTDWQQADAAARPPLDSTSELYHAL